MSCENISLKIKKNEYKPTILKYLFSVTRLRTSICRRLYTENLNYLLFFFNSISFKYLLLVANTNYYYIIKII